MANFPGAPPGQVAGMAAGGYAQQAGLAGLTNAQLAGLSAQQVCLYVKLACISKIKSSIWC